MRGKKRRPRRFRWGSGKDHPRICGEKTLAKPLKAAKVGSPPHMRGKGALSLYFSKVMRITPAYAGKRCRVYKITGTHWDHPRICGEKEMSSISCNLDSGSPPHMRGKVINTLLDSSCGRITPAYAGKSVCHCSRSRRCEDHPRICGEKPFFMLTSLSLWGSPPHMRGKGKDCPQVLEDCGITPAYAGKSSCFGGSAFCAWDHPRICGEKAKYWMQGREPEGSPPHMRGKGKILDARQRARGITPAYAGKRL